MQDNFIKAVQGLTCHPTDQKHTVPFSPLTTEEEKKKSSKDSQLLSSTHVRWFVMLPISLIILLWGWSGEERIGRKDGGGMWKNATF